MECKKSNKIREIVRLQQLLKKWRKQANSSKPPTSTGSSTTATTAAAAAATTTTTNSGSKSIKFLKRTLSLSESSSNGSSEGLSSSNGAVPKGYLAVGVGVEQKRFTIPTEYLSHPAFHILLREAEEEFGFQQAGVLRIPCEVSVFESVVKIVEEKKDAVCFVQQQDCRFDVEDGAAGYGYCSLSGQQNSATPSHHPQSPMCR